MDYLLNNWHNLDHLKMYGGSAFFDLWAHKTEDKRAGEMRAGDTCHVISRAKDGKVAISVYAFDRTRLGSSTEDPPRTVWILEGRFLDEVVLERSIAAGHPRYARFFNRLGHVNQWSVLRCN